MRAKNYSKFHEVKEKQAHTSELRNNYYNKRNFFQIYQRERKKCSYLYFKKSVLFLCFSLLKIKSNIK